MTLVVGLLNDSLSPTVDYYSEMGTGFTIADIGWPAVGAASWMAPFAGLAIPIGLVLNLILVRLKLTKTLNVDIWNYMHFLVPGALAYFIFDNFFIGLAVTVILSVLALFVGDWVCTYVARILWLRRNDLYHDYSYRLDTNCCLGDEQID